jgi:uncharacterized protein (DUF58 family)
MRLLEKLRAYQKAIPETPYREGLLIRLYYFWFERFTSAGRALISAAWIALLLFMVPGAYLARFFLVLLFALLLTSFIIRERKPKVKIISVSILPVREKETGVLVASIQALDDYPSVSIDAFRASPSLKKMTCVSRFFKTNEVESVELKIKTAHRGSYIFKNIAALVPDPLGLIQTPVFYNGSLEFLVYPKRLKISQFSFLTKGHPGREFALLLMPSLQRGVDFSGVRPYREGDSVRDIDHRAYARYLKPFTKEFSVEEGSSVVFVLDIRFSSFSKKIFMEKAIALAAAMATWFEERQILGRFFINNQEIDLTRGEKLDLLMAALSRIETPRFKSSEPPGIWSPEALPMGPVFAITLSPNASNLIQKQIVVSDETGGDDSLMYFDPSNEEEVFL